MTNSTDPERIPRIIELLQRRWQAQPDRRLGQILDDAIVIDEHQGQLRDVEDAAIEAGLSERVVPATRPSTELPERYRTDEFQTIRGWAPGYEPAEPAYFAYSASLRIMGIGLDLDEISRAMRLEPTSSHLAGERKGPRSPPYKKDQWSYDAQIDEEQPLDEHIDALWDAIQPREEYLLGMKAHADVDMAGFEVPHTSLESFIRLGIPFSISVIITERRGEGTNRHGRRVMSGRRCHAIEHSQRRRHRPRIQRTSRPRT